LLQYRLREKAIHDEGLIDREISIWKRLDRGGIGCSRDIMNDKALERWRPVVGCREEA
jgi:hypothetical protein